MIWGFSFSLPFSFFFTSLHSCCYIPLLLFLLPAFTVSLSAVSVLYLAVFFVLLRDDRLTGDPDLDEVLWWLRYYPVCDKFLSFLLFCFFFHFFLPFVYVGWLYFFPSSFSYFTLCMLSCTLEDVGFTGCRHSFTRNWGRVVVNSRRQCIFMDLYICKYLQVLVRSKFQIFISNRAEIAFQFRLRWLGDVTHNAGGCTVSWMNAGDPTHPIKGICAVALGYRLLQHSISSISSTLIAFLCQGLSLGVWLILSSVCLALFCLKVQGFSHLLSSIHDARFEASAKVSTIPSGRYPCSNK